MPGTAPCPWDTPGSETSPRSMHERLAAPTQRGLVHIANLGSSQCAAHWGWADTADLARRHRHARGRSAAQHTRGSTPQAEPTWARIKLFLA
eukprot:2392997-Pyramimonas_sp.AAC.1